MVKKVAIIGTQGVPARYGGFETLVENIIGDTCSSNVQYTIFCSSKDLSKEKRLSTYKGANLKYIPLHANGVESIPYDIISLLQVIKGYEVILLLGVSGCLFLPFFRLLCRKRLIINIDGLEHRRAKWGRLARWVLRISEKVAVRYADVIIADNKGIQDYVTETYNKKSTLIAYGGNYVEDGSLNLLSEKFLAEYGLRRGEYAITVCRIEPENNCHLILQAFAGSGRKLVFIGNWKHSEYGLNLIKKYRGFLNIMMLDAIYDLDVLYTLRANAEMYVHGHSAGGTNPSLVEAMFFACPILCYDVVYNRETTHNQAYYWKNTSELQVLFKQSDLDGSIMRTIAEKEYTWEHIAAQYEELYFVDF